MLVYKDKRRHRPFMGDNYYQNRARVDIEEHELDIALLSAAIELHKASKKITGAAMRRLVLQGAENVKIGSFALTAATRRLAARGWLVPLNVNAQGDITAYALTDKTLRAM